MTEWGVVLVVISLFGFLVAVITPILKLNQSITKLNITLDQTNNIVQSIDEKIDDHEHRLTVLEGQTIELQHEIRDIKGDIKAWKK